jgi:hypothetical protein
MTARISLIPGRGAVINRALQRAHLVKQFFSRQLVLVFAVSTANVACQKTMEGDVRTKDG